MKESPFAEKVQEAEEVLTENNTATLEVKVFKHNRVATTIMMSKELKKIFKDEAPRSLGSFSNYLEKLIEIDFKERGLI